MLTLFGRWSGVTPTSDPMHHTDKVLSALLVDYSAARDDERELLNQQVTLFSVVVATLGLFGALVTSLGKEDGDFYLPDEAAAVTPLIPLALISMLQIIGSQATVRSFYNRALEREIRKRIEPIGDLGTCTDLRPMFLRELIDTMSSLSSGRRIPRLLTLIIFFVIAFVFVGLVFYMARDFGIYLKIAMLGIYGSATVLILAESINATVRGRSYFTGILAAANSRANEPLTQQDQTQSAADRPRNLISYLLVPRPLDLPKSSFFFLGSLMLISLNDTIALTADFWMQVFVLAFVVDFLLYQCRYQLNDLRGISEDISSPGAAQRGRIPVGSSGVRNVIVIVLAAMVVRIYVAVIVCALPYISFFHHLIPAAVSVFGLAALYEWIRARERNATPATPVNKAVVVLVYAVVGLGYPLRAGLGILLPGTGGNPVQDIPWDWKWPARWSWGDGLGPLERLYLPVSWVPLLLMLFICFLLGIIFVSMTWCLEAGGYVDYRESPGVARFHYKSGILSKPHLLCAIRQTGNYFGRSVVPVPTLQGSLGDHEVKGRDCAWLKESRSWVTLWNFATILATGVGVMLMYSIWHSGWSSSAVSSSAASALVAVNVLYTRRASGLRRMAGGAALPLLLLFVAIFSAWSLGASSALIDLNIIEMSYPTKLSKFIVSILAVAGPFCIYLFFEPKTYNTLMQPLVSRAQLAKARYALIRLVLGKRTTADYFPIPPAPPN